MAVDLTEISIILLFFYNVCDSVAPEGGYYVKSKKVLVVAGEEDNRGGGVRSSLAIYTYGSNKPSYPTFQSELKNYESEVCTYQVTGVYFTMIFAFPSIFSLMGI